MTYAEYKKQKIPMDDLKIFFAFGDEQIKKGLKKLNKKHGTNLHEKDLCCSFGQMIGTAEDIGEYVKRFNEKYDKVPEMFTPQQVYNTEFFYHKCGCKANDEEAIEIVIELFGREKASEVKRKYSQ